jgi:hypothetical protein
MEFINGPPGSDLAGPESWRTTIYGSEIVIAGGARLLPLLAVCDLYVESEPDLDALLADCNLIVANLADISRATDTDPDKICHRVENIRQAIHRAQGASGCVVIW